ncbi:type I secretion system permease/ATPase [Erythrobacter sp. HKB08]|uniref:type I secretion system permease/ATPase n=1 Tax=Erythrobacter sp. HKB08 TaxID=2502843 RepID=UPI0013E8D812|nr:type I secretion system permease/ATPase [Erythrobacter sp. HKB08]
MTDIPHAATADPLLACVEELARHFGLPFDAAQGHTLAKDAEGRTPMHQAGAALELAGLNYDRIERKRLPLDEDLYPALVERGEAAPAIIRQVTRDQVLLWTPESGEDVWVDRKAFAEEFGGGMYSVVGDPDRLREQGSPWYKKARHHWFWSELNKERRAFRSVLLASLLINLLALALPLFTMNVYDRVIPNKAVSTLWVLGVGVLLAFALEFALRTARTNVVDQIGRRLDMRLSQKIFSRVIGLPLASRQGSTGALAARVSEYGNVREFFASTSVVLVVDLLFLFVFVGVIAIIAGWLALVPITAMILMGIAGFILQRKVSEAARDAQSDHGLQQTLLVESVAGAETLKSLAGEGSIMGRWYTLSDIGSRSHQRLKRINSIAVGLASSFQQISTISLIIGGYYLFDSGAITMGAIIAIVMLSSRSLAPAGQIAFLLTRARQARETLTSIENLFDGEDERTLGRTSPPAVPRRCSIKLDACSFAYPDAARAALDRVDLTIQPGEKIALIGRVASGKSTLGRILCGLYPPSDGAMLVDGIDSRQFRPSDLRRAFRFVGQDALLFTGSVKDNLQLGGPDAAEPQLHEALKAVGAEEFIARDEVGFDRQVGEQGRRLSGGQRAFIALARAFVSPSELLVLDEPTGNMDSRTEALFVDRLREKLQPEQTLVVATHRPALFSLCDRIIVLDQGRIVADGPKEQILAQARQSGGIEA